MSAQKMAHTGLVHASSPTCRTANSRSVDASTSSAAQPPESSLSLHAPSSPSASRPSGASTPALSSTPTSSLDDITNPEGSEAGSTATTHLANAKLRRILKLVEELVEQCRICWFRGEINRPHASYRCKTGVCSGGEWASFKSNIRFPKRVVCFLCFAPYGPPFNHDVPPPGSRYTGDLCEYPDVLKELSYILYQDADVRGKVFANLGIPAPCTLAAYKRYIARTSAGGLLGLFEVVFAYLQLREADDNFC